MRGPFLVLLCAMLALAGTDVCKSLGKDWKTDTLATLTVCRQPSGGFAYLLPLPPPAQDSAMGLADRELALQDWTEDLFLAKTKWTSTSTPKACSLDARTACEALTVRNGAGKALTLFAALDRKCLVFASALRSAAELAPLVQLCHTPTWNANPP